MMKAMPGWIRLSAMLLLIAFAGAALGQSAATYPNRVVRGIVPYPPGGNNDLMSRMVFAWLGKSLGQSFIVENRPGGDTVIGTVAVAKAPPDGYTLLIHSDAMLANHWLQLELPYDTLRDFTLITSLATTESALLVSNGAPADNLRALVGYVKANPEKLNAAIGSPLNMLSFQRFMNGTDTKGKFTLVNYKGAAPALADLISGNVHAFLSNLPSAKPLIRGGKVRSLAVSGPRRDPEIPDVATFDEGGVKGFQPSGPLQNMLLTPSRTPADVVEKLNALVAKALVDPEIVRNTAKLGITTLYLTVPEADRTFRAELERFGQLVKDAGLKPGQI